MKKNDFIKAMGLDETKNKFIKLGENNYILRKPSALELMQIEDNNISVEGTDVYGYIKDILAFISPSLSMSDVIIPVKKEIKIGDKTLTFSKLTEKEYFDIISNTQKIVLDNGVRKAKLNQVETIKKIINIADEEIDINTFSIDELRSIVGEFSELYDATYAMKIFETFQM